MLFLGAADDRPSLFGNSTLIHCSNSRQCMGDLRHALSATTKERTFSALLFSPSFFFGFVKKTKSLSPERSIQVVRFLSAFFPCIIKVF